MEKINLENLAQGAKNLEEINTKIENEENIEERNKLFQEAAAIEGGLDLIEKELGLNEEEVLKEYDKINITNAYEEIQKLTEKGLSEEDLKENNFGGIINLLKKIKLPMPKIIRLAACALLLSVAFGATNPEMSFGKEPEKITKQEKNEDVFQELKDWRAEWKAENIISDEELKDYIGFYKARAGKAIEMLEKKTKIRKLHKVAKEKSKREGTYKIYTDKDGNQKESYSLRGFKWSYQKKNWVEDKINIVKNSNKTGKKAEIGNSKESLNSEDYFTQNGKGELLRILNVKFGKNGKKAFDYNTQLLKGEFKKYQLGELSGKELINLLQQNNDNLRNMGAKFDIFDINKFSQDIKTTVNNHDGADSDAW